ncbi:helix-turn-helix domain-containing protein [Paenibacillus sp. LMG 31456]|uniref:Helix-turn-helix domain-containing protein n=1 Tax=Paenibacillus foliorum TaxID=2654974 RepID=A0A972GNQ6_9BACL|nr:AraC family transcriptional regulator [Paenibacillus foliorum]NOU94032.1 helix-turn-helix domain-containing protein [Paenibacillus foliorum]
MTVQISTNFPSVSFFKKDIQPILKYAGQICNEPRWSFERHKHDDLSEIVYIVDGEGSFIIGDKEYVAGRGDLIIYNQGVSHEERSKAENPLKTYYCGVSNLAIEGIDEGCILPRHQSPVIRTNALGSKIEGLFSQIFEEVNSQTMGCQIICQNYLSSLLVFIHRIVSAHESLIVSSEQHSVGYQIQEFLDNHFMQDISLNEIANSLYISPYYLSRIFKEKTGYSPINYVIQLRIGEAKKLLLTSNLTIQEISHRMGYDNSNYFSVLFKKVTGASPNQFRKKSK